MEPIALYDPMQVDPTTSGAGFVVSVLYLIGMWKVFSKAGEAGWQALIPIWNIIVLLRITGHSAWWLLLMLIPVVNIVVYAIVILDLSKSFGHGLGFALGLIFFPFVFLLILGFGSDSYVGAGGMRTVPAT